MSHNQLAEIQTGQLQTACIPEQNEFAEMSQRVILFEVIGSPIVTPDRAECGVAKGVRVELSKATGPIPWREMRTIVEDKEGFKLTMIVLALEYVVFPHRKKCYCLLDLNGKRNGKAEFFCVDDLQMFLGDAFNIKLNKISEDVPDPEVRVSFSRTAENVDKIIKWGKYSGQTRIRFDCSSCLTTVHLVTNL